MVNTMQGASGIRRLLDGKQQLRKLESFSSILHEKTCTGLRRYFFLT